MSGTAVAEPADGRRADGLTLFAVLWAVAALAHVLGNTHYSPRPVLVAVCLTALCVLVRPERLWPLALLSVAQIVSVWCEAPILGNHWLLSGLVGLAWLLCLASGPRDRESVARRFLPIARLTLLSFYGFAAFAKLNSGYFHSATSCGSYYLSESASSLGLGGLHLGHGVSAWVAIVGSVVAEAAVFTLLLVRRTRPYGVLLGLAFHFVLALDRTHEFFDFSAVVYALFSTFMPPPFAHWLVSSARRRALAAGAAVQRTVVGIVLAAVVGPALLASLFRSTDTSRLARFWGCDLWVVFGSVCMVVTAGWALDRRRRGRPIAASPPRQLRPAATLALLVPLLTLFNGFTPYLEVKTAYGWNMYGNLRTVDGRSNHAIVRRSFPVTSTQHDLITIESSDDPALQWYADNHYALPALTLRAYASHHPRASLTFVEHGRRTVLAHLSERADLVRPVPELQAKFQLFRAVDTEHWPRCQDVFGPVH